MKIILLFSSILLFLTTCINDADSDTDLVGDWRLTEVLADPGNGSGTFRSVDSNKIITFNNDGTISSNGNLCNISTESNNPTSGTYSLEESTLNSTICNDPDFNFPFEKEGKTLTITYFCIEACAAKFRKI